MRLLYSINLTLDGCIDHRAIVPDRDLHEHAADLIAGSDVLLFGRVVYGMMEEAWRPVAETGQRPDWMPEWMEPFARTIHAARKLVASDTLAGSDWNAEVVRSADLESTVRRLKAQPGGQILAGGVRFPLALAELGLIDEYELILHPRLAGHGPRLFDGLTRPLNLEPTGRKELRSGAVALRYRPRT